jgi:mono/diheme cytochrome c family protein
MSRVAFALRATAAAALALACIACGDSDTGPAPPAPPPATPQPVPPSPSAQPAPTAPIDQPPPAPEPSPAAPAASGGTPDPARGAPLYAQYCATCHGPKGEGDGPLSPTLNPKPAKHSDGGYMNQLSDEHLFKTIKEGGPAVGKSPLMAPWGGTLTDAQIHDVVAFVRTLADPPYEP